MNNLGEAIANLFFYYFVFNLAYPTRFKQCLGFFHTLIFSFEEIKIKKSEKFKKIQEYIIKK